MNKGVKLKGTKDVLRTIQKISAKSVKTVPEKVERAAFEIEAEAASTVRVDTARLKNSIQTIKEDDTHYEVSSGGMKIDGVEVDYAWVIEFGGKKRSAYPYMRPAAAKVQNKYPDMIITGIAQAIKQAGVH